MELRREGDGYVIVDGEARIGPIASRSVAFAEVMARDGRVHLAWRRTVIGGNVVPRSFQASFEDEDGGSIAKNEHGGFTLGSWQAFAGGLNKETNRYGTGTQIVDTKDEAVEFVERQFTRLMAGDAKPLSNAYAKAKGG
jgi:hypothetical protein